MLVLSYLAYLILLFFVISVLGWCMEVVLKYQEFHRFINRGFLIGPYLPIYGSGVVFITLVCDVVSKYDDSWEAVFLASFVICGLWEYFISWALEKRYQARWWDYSRRPMNLNGRVWIGNLILFGIGGLLVQEFLSPFFKSVIGRVPLTVQLVLSGLVIAVMGTDFVFSQFIMSVIRTGIRSSQADNTEDISKEIRALVADRSALYSRVLEAYPDVVYRTEKIRARMDSVKEAAERLKEEAERHYDESSDRLRRLEESVRDSIDPLERVAKGKSGNLFDYLKWRGDLPLEADPLNEVDRVLLDLAAGLSLSLSNEDGVRVPLDKAAFLYFEENAGSEPLRNLSIRGICAVLLREMAKSPRFKGLQLSSAGRGRLLVYDGDSLLYEAQADEDGWPELLFCQVMGNRRRTAGIGLSRK